MKSPLRMFRGMKVNKVESKEVKQQRRPSTKPDELIRAMQDMHEMRSCYDSLLSAAATTANNAHEFSEALEELGTCLLQKTALNDDEDSEQGLATRALMMMGKAQFELQKHFDSYRSHILHTMDKPSRSLLGEIENVESEIPGHWPHLICALAETGLVTRHHTMLLREMKHLCDDRRETYRNIEVASGGKGRSCHFQEKTSTKELLEAKATRHHAAQISFFRNGLKALEMVESQVKAVADRHHIDYSVSDLEDDNDDDTYGSDDEGLSFNFQKSFQEQNVVYISGNYIEEKTCKSQSGMHKSNLRTHISQSAPIFANKKLDSSEKIETLPAVRKFHAYVLPTPHNDRNLNPSPHTAPSLETPTPNDRSPGPRTTAAHPSSHTTPLETKASQSPKKSEFLGTTKSSRNATTTGNRIYSGPIWMPSDFSEKPSGPPFNRHEAYAANKLNRHAFFSGPLTNQPVSNKPIVSPQYRHSTEFPHPVSSASQQMPKPKSSISPNVASRTLPPVTSLKISELHELPRPPISSEKATGPSSFIGYSGPLVSRAKNNMMSSRPSSVHPLPNSLGEMSRSFSNPSNSRRIPVFAMSKLLEIPQNPVRIEEITSPPPTHLPSMTMLPVLTTS
ncbi:hypothetical protein ZIOFF_058499 [Zingiber officinale]|uniref:Hydroxyproline-rich glycoprotein family protein n=1 Tax=Zingiber officinale TaxID=94328 RepID=A0A8J5KDX4_ZINOF|nr:hypothetical protein ZIOFF_058499 [Zingiber officinale]